MKNIVLIHGYNGVPKVYNWIEEELSKNQEYNNIIIPKFPVAEGVIYENWKTIMDKYKGYLEKNTIVVAHSIGNEFLIKYLNENNINIGLYISLAGFAEYFYTENKADLNRAVNEFLVTNEEKNKIKQLAKIRYAIYSDNDHIVPFEVLKKYVEDIEAIPQFITGIGHMGKKSGIEKIQEILDIIDKENYILN